MSMCRKSLSAFALVFSILFATSGYSQQTLGADNFRRAAVIALESGQSENAKSFALALLKRDETDFTARLIHTRTQRDLGEYREAVGSARVATKMADSKAQKYPSFLIFTQTLSSNGNKTRAQLWLRRTMQNAHHPKLAERAAKDFKYVQRTNPWRTDFEFTLDPSSNINNGSARETSQLNYR